MRNKRSTRGWLLLAALCWLLGATPVVADAPDAWPTRGHDPRRTGQSRVNGPQQPAVVARRTIPNGAGINIAATVDGSGTAYFGTWGLVISHGETDRSRWDKADGQVYAWQPVLQAATPHFVERWGRGHVDSVPYCYDFQDGWNLIYCPTPANGDLSWWNGTVEGTATLSPDEQTLYVGRGDGKVYALDSATGARRWTFHTCNDVADCNLPTSDPEGGGEVIAGLLLRGADELYLGTWGVVNSGHESSAFYRLDAADGSLAWRYPISGSLPGVVVAAPALSPDGETIYFATWCEASDCAGSLYAFAPDGSLRWPPVELRGPDNAPVDAWTLAVGSDGTVYLGGQMGNDCNAAVVLAHHANGARRWGPVSLPSAPFAFPCANIAGGLALREVNGQTVRVYATTNFVAELSGIGQPSGGRLFALDPMTGAQPWGNPFFDPTTAPVNGFGNAVYPSIGADGTVYFGVSGAYAGGLPVYRVERDGKVLAVSEAGQLRWQYTVDGAIAWGHPVIGPDGTLFVGEMQDRYADALLRPVEDPVFVGYDFAPALYAIRDRAAESIYLPLIVR